MKTLSIDLESYSGENLARGGAYRYAAADDFELLLFAYAVDDGPVHVVSTATGEHVPDAVVTALADPQVTKRAWNAQFERVVLSRWLQQAGRLPAGEYLDPAGWECTMVWASALGLPRALKDAGAALNLDKQKLDEGRDLIQFFCTPTRGRAADAPQLFDADGLEHRHRPESAPEKWADFIEYCRRDVEVETAIRQRLDDMPLPPFVWAEYAVDQRINDAGVRIDQPLAAAAIHADDAYRAHCLDEAQELTGLDNPASPTQLQAWLADQGVEVASMAKQDVADALATATGTTRRVLELRQDMSRSSTKKYEAMENAVCPDGRARGLTQFYGAGRTGRWAGRLIQVQNLPRNYLPDLDQARALVRAEQHQAVEMLYPSVPDTLSQLIRTAFIPAEGMRFIVADYSAIEARVLAWLAGEQKTLDAFAAGEDLYCVTASAMFGVPVDKHGPNADLRQKGKIAVLACIAEGQEVLTDHGPVPIENVTTRHRVWDGHEWIAHDGLIDRGVKNVITYDGLTATPDHLVWVTGETRPVPLGDAAARRARLAQTGDGRHPLRLGGNHLPGETLGPEVAHLLRPDPLHRLRLRAMAAPGESHPRRVEGMPALLPAADHTAVARPEVDRGEATVHQPRRPRVPALWRAWNRIQILLGHRGRPVGHGQPGAGEAQGARPDRQRRPLRAGEHPVGHPDAAVAESAPVGDAAGLGPRRLAVLEAGGHPEAGGGHDPRGNHRRRGEGRGRTPEELAGNPSKARVYDLLNAGPRHRFTVAGKLVHNCGYQGGVGAMRAMGALRMGIEEHELKPIVDAWRDANRHVVDFWWRIDQAAIDAIRTGRPQRVRAVTLRMRAGALTITLPSGRTLVYPGARLGTNRFGKPSVTFKGIGMNRKFQTEETYGGKLTENITQAVARDLLAHALGVVADAGHRIVMHVHDEIVVEAPPETTVEEICDLMAQAPDWATGLPLAADGFDCPYYQKD